MQVLHISTLRVFRLNASTQIRMIFEGLSTHPSPRSLNASTAAVSLVTFHDLSIFP